MIAWEVKEEAGWKCERCGHEDSFEAGRVLTVHHLDRNKKNNMRWNLAALCQRCHLWAEAKVWLGQLSIFEHPGWLKPHIEGFLSGCEKSLSGVYQRP